jgi:hypothetical protein
MSAGVHTRGLALDETQEPQPGDGELQPFVPCNALPPVDDNIGHVLVSQASELTGKAQTCRKFACNVCGARAPAGRCLFLFQALTRSTRARQ